MSVSEQTQTETALTELTVKVPERLVEMARAQVASGRIADVDAVVGNALHQLDERQRRLTRLRAFLQEGLDSGDPIEFTEELMDDIERRAEERYLRSGRLRPTSSMARGVLRWESTSSTTRCRTSSS